MITTNGKIEEKKVYGIKADFSYDIFHNIIFLLHRVLKQSIV